MPSSKVKILTSKPVVLSLAVSSGLSDVSLDHLEGLEGFLGHLQGWGLVDLEVNLGSGDRVSGLDSDSSS